jgi:hypothetical protein
MADPVAPVREISRLADVDGATVRVGVDCDSVTIGGPRPIRLDAAGRDLFSRLYFEAERAAEAWAKAWTVSSHD